MTADEHLVVYDIAARRLTELGIAGDNAAWSPDNRRLAYDHDGKIYVYGFEDNASAEIGQGARPEWSPDGENVAVRAGRRTIELLNIHTRARAPLLEGTYAVPRWSPNGEWMMYSVSGGGRWWSFDDAAIEVRRIIVRNTKTGGEAVVGRFAKGNPGNYTWTTNPELCKREP